MGMGSPYHEQSIDQSSIDESAPIKTVLASKLTVEECPICFETFDKKKMQAVIKLACQHVYHPDCLTLWFKSPD